MQLAKRVWDYSTGQGLLHPGDRVVIGVSGGPDSLCLLDVLHHLAARHGLELHVAHLNHGLRPDAAADAEFVRAEAAVRACRFWTETADVRAAAAARKLSLETAARELRYDFLWRVAGQASAERVAVAHTADDQAETVLMHILRGTGLRGLRGMLPKRVMDEVYLIRPLLRTTRADVVFYCAEHKLAPRTDSSNDDRSFTRNRVRHELMPALEAFNPNIGTTLARMAEAAAGDYEIWLDAVSALWQATVQPGDGEAGEVAFGRQSWLALSGAQQRALLRAAVERLTGELADVDFAPIDAAAEFSRRAAPGRSCQVAPGLALRVETDRLRLVLGAPPDPVDWPWMVGDALARGWQLVVEPLGSADQSAPSIAAAPRWTAYVDAEKLVGPLVLRSRRPGDRFQPLGMQGHTAKLSDFLVNLKIPTKQRERWPLLTCGNDIVWVVGLRLDERFKVGDQTRSTIRLSIRRAEAE